MKRLLLLGSLFLAGCVVNNSHYITTSVTTVSVDAPTTITEDNDTITTTTQAAPAPQVVTIPVAQSHPVEASKSSTGCGVFHLPELKEIPEAPDFENPELATGTDVDVAIGSYIRNLRRQMRDERYLLEKAYREYLSHCANQ